MALRSQIELASRGRLCVVATVKGSGGASDSASQCVGRAFSESVDDDVGGAPCVEPTDERTFDDSIKSKVWPG